MYYIYIYIYIYHIYYIIYKLILFDNRVIEYADHLCEHMVYPATIVNAKYQMPQVTKI